MGGELARASSCVRARSRLQGLPKKGTGRTLRLTSGADSRLTRKGYSNDDTLRSTQGPRLREVARGL